MKDNKKVAINTVFYFIYQCIIFVAPLIIMPYLTRVLSDSVLGQHSYSYSIAFYFVLGANLGISRYGQREISSYKDDKEILKNKFWSLFYVHSFFSIISFAAYIAFFFIAGKVNLYVFIIPYVISALFDVTWFFYGMENFKIVTIVNSIFVAIKAVLIFLLVKSNGDLWIYQFLSFGATLLSQVVIFVFAIKTIGRPIKVSKKDCVQHLKPLFYFALATLAVSLYTYLDKILLGLMVSDSKKSVAYYECADKIIAVPRMLITTLGVVLYPKMCSLTKKSETEEVREFTKFSIDWTSFLSFGAMFGILVVAVPLSLLYYGQDYITTGYCMMLMVPLIFIISFGEILRSQYILPNKKDKVYLLSISINAVINLICNIALIPVFGIYGVIIASIIAELAGLIFQLVYCRKVFPHDHALKSVGIHLVAGLMMFMLLLGINSLLPVYGWINILIIVLSGLIIYTFALQALSKLLHYESIVDKFINKVIKRNK